ncbi:MAG TPA: hypothetical protein P5323_01585 [Candidatus Moranbacteria bacterium]|nr:hypothetical protein [Candidatus Moranbacteria bacterium]HRY27806.1 hypothetical protein [Candidatus Moranbacteria bacterium]HSA08115.1 hypothetical protein [Candidatus Moranbacteria bacterium]
MFFHIQIFFYSLIFFFISQVISSEYFSNVAFPFSAKKLWIAIPLLIILLVYLYNVAKSLSQRTSMVPIPLFFAVSTWVLLFFVQSPKQQYTLLALSAIAYYFIHIALYRLNVYYKDKTARGIVAAGSLATIFIFYAAAYGIYLNYAIPLWVLMASLMLVTALVSFQYLWLIHENKKNVLNHSLILGFIIAEIVWVLNFWPFGYLTTSVITLIFYYVFWDLTACHFLDKLSKKRVIANIVFFGFLVVLVLSSARWMPIV